MTKLDRDWMTLPDGTKIPRPKRTIVLGDPTNQPDSQAGDELLQIVNTHIKAMIQTYNNGKDSFDYTGMVKDLGAYAERLATKRAIAEAKLALKASWKAAEVEAKADLLKWRDQEVQKQVMAARIDELQDLSKSFEDNKNYTGYMVKQVIEARINHESE